MKCISLVIQEIFYYHFNLIKILYLPYDFKPLSFSSIKTNEKSQNSLKPVETKRHNNVNAIYNAAHSIIKALIIATNNKVVCTVFIFHIFDVVKLLSFSHIKTNGKVRINSNLQIQHL